MYAICVLLKYMSYIHPLLPHNKDKLVTPLLEQPLQFNLLLIGFKVVFHSAIAKDIEEITTPHQEGAKTCG